MIRRKGIWVWAAPLMPFAAEGLIAAGDIQQARDLSEAFARGLRGRDAPSAKASLGYCRGSVATLRDPAAFGNIDAQVSGYFEQAVRTSFNFRRRGLQTEFARRVRRDFTLVGRYALSQTELFDERISDEERPDIDAIYMQATVAMTGSGGWPMSVFLTPAGKPFFAGTYFPPEDRHGMPSFRRVLEHVADIYRERRTEVEEASNEVQQAISKSMRVSSEGAVDSIQLVSRIPLDLVRTIAVTPESATSVVLTKVLLPEADHVPLGEEADARLLIGDAALKSAFEDPTPHHDLGRLWLERTGLPMVFAVWAAREPVADGMPELERALAESLRLARAEQLCFRCPGSYRTQALAARSRGDNAVADSLLSRAP